MRTLLERVRAVRRRRAADRDRVLAWLVSHQVRQCPVDCPFYHPLPD